MMKHYFTKHRLSENDNFSYSDIVPGATFVCGIPGNDFSKLVVDDIFFVGQAINQDYVKYLIYPRLPNGKYSEEPAQSQEKPITAFAGFLARNKFHLIDEKIISEKSDFSEVKENILDLAITLDEFIYPSKKHRNYGGGNIDYSTSMIEKDIISLCYDMYMDMPVDGDSPANLKVDDLPDDELLEIMQEIYNEYDDQLAEYDIDDLEEDIPETLDYLREIRDKLQFFRI